MVPAQQQFPSEETADPSPTAVSPEPYQFPTDKLKRQQTEHGKVPLVLVGCGSYSPITYLHLRMFIMAFDFIRLNTKFEVVGAYLSPVSDAYKKVGLAPAHHRVNMCRLVVENSDWIMVDPFEATARNASGEPEYVPTAEVLSKHFDREINDVTHILDTNGQPARARIALLAGADLIQTMSQPGLWTREDLDLILGDKHGAFIIERAGTDIDEALGSLRQYKKNIWVISQVIQNDISSTKVRLFLKKDLSVRYLIPDPVVTYIEQHKLYALERDVKDSDAKGSGQPDEGSTRREKEKDGVAEEDSLTTAAADGDGQR